MPANGVVIMGLGEALAELQRVQSGAQSFGGYTAQVGSSLPYAFGIHYGRHPGGRLARRAGGLFYLTRALEQVRNRGDVRAMVAEGVVAGPLAARKAGRTLAFAVLARAQELETAVDSGLLRNSLRVAEGGASAGPSATSPQAAIVNLVPSSATGRRQPS